MEAGSESPRESPLHLELVGVLCRAWLDEVRAGAPHDLVIVSAASTDLESVVFSTDALGPALVDLQQTLGEGPAVVAVASGSAVFIPDMASVGAGSGGVAFAREALQVGVGSYRAVPLHIGVVGLGVIAVHSRSPSVLTPVQSARLIGLADDIALALLLSGDPDGVPGGDGALASGRGPDAAEQDLGRAMLGSPRAVVHQACGMVMVQLGSTMHDAMTSLRGYAFGSGRSLEAVARDVVDRRLRFPPGGIDPATLDPGLPKGP